MPKSTETLDTLEAKRPRQSSILAQAVSLIAVCFIMGMCALGVAQSSVPADVHSSVYTHAGGGASAEEKGSSSSVVNAVSSSSSLEKDTSEKSATKEEAQASSNIEPEEVDALNTADISNEGAAEEAAGSNASQDTAASQSQGSTGFGQNEEGDTQSASANATPSDAVSVQPEPEAQPEPEPEAQPEPAPVPAPAPASITVSVSVSSDAVGSPVSGSTTVQLSEGATAFDALLASGFTVDSRNTAYGAYVAGIGGLSEREHGGSSGWLYAVNGTTPGYSAASYVLADGDSVSWFYTA